MLSFYNYLLRSKPLVSLLFCYFVIAMIGLVQKLFMFSLGSGDIFYYLFNFIKSSIDSNNTSASKLLSYVMFFGSFYGIFIKAFLYVFIILIYGAALQFIIHIFVQYPSRFSNVLAALFTNVAVFFILNVIPFAGLVLFAVGVVYFSAKKIGEINGFSTAWGVLLLIAPKIIGLLVLLLTATSFFNLVSFF